MKKIFLITAITVVTIASCTKDKGDLAINPYLNCDTIHFSQTVAPIISQFCSTTPGCHVPSGVGPDYTTYAGLKIKLDAGVFQNRIFNLRDMPQTPNPPLADSTLQKLQCWVNQGYPNN